ncbi:MAG: ABC transporter ATP-binding protein [Acidimicrobiales bacterium]|nr:ABC transporter ATP-binding protein [Acidimicrobiales bacterium]
MAAVIVDGVSKRFRLVHERNSSIKAIVMSGMKRVVYDELWALEDVSFQVDEGETFALVGHNGSGKSTALKCLAGIYRPDDGEITLNGSMSALLELGAGFHPELSGRENVYLNAAILGLPKKEIDLRFDDIVAFAGLERFIDHPVKNYSSGMFVRLGFSVAINVEPEILLVDEVLAVGDEEFQRRCLAKIRQFRNDGRTVVVVTHSLATVQTLCDRALWLDHGVAQALGPADEVARQYLESVTGVQTKDHEILLDIDCSLERTAGSHDAEMVVRTTLQAMPADGSIVIELVDPNLGVTIAGARHVTGGHDQFDVECTAAGLPIAAGRYACRVTAFDGNGDELDRDERPVYLLESNAIADTLGPVRVPFTFSAPSPLTSDR